MESTLYHCVCILAALIPIVSAVALIPDTLNKDGMRRPGSQDSNSFIEFRGIDIPKQFSTYDLNSDRKISLRELTEVTETKKEDAQRPFNDADQDGNNYLTIVEFTQAPWLFEAGEVIVE